MKTYFRILSFAQPLGRFALPYAIFSLIHIVFGLLNFSLLIPILNVLFKTSEDVQGKAVALLAQSPPTFEWDTKYFIDLFNYYLSVEIQQSGNYGALKFVCIVLVVCVFISNIFRYLAQALIEDIKVRTVRNLRNTVYNKTTSLHLGYFTNERKGDIMARITTDVQEVEFSVANTISVVFKEPLTLIGYFFILLQLSASLTLFTLLIIPISGLIIGTVTKRLKKDAFDGQMSMGRLITILDESLSGMRVIKGFNAVGYIRDKFRNENEYYTNVTRRMALRREMAPPISEFFGAIVISIILLYGGAMVLDHSGTMSASVFVAYVAIFSQVLRPAKALTGAFSNVQKGLASGERIFQILDAESLVMDKPTSSKLPAFEQKIEFKNVSFKYGDKYVLHNISFTINKGETVALVGPSGGGKSTIADLLPRFYDVAEGEILIDGIDLRDIEAESLRHHMGIVTQESVLFNDSIANNISFSNVSATREQIEAAAKVANAHQFITQTENKYDTYIGDRGVKLSGGQRQRLNIARAVLRNPSILILDEATSALDTESEKLVQEALNKLMESRTVLVIAHRLSTIQHADKILVIEEGRIVEQGTHNDLIEQQNGLYRRLQLMQAS